MQQTNHRTAMDTERGYGEQLGLLQWTNRKARNLAEVAHDARNMVTALGLYCELLEEPGVLSPSFRHYGGELRLLASASQRLVEKLVALNGAGGTEARGDRALGSSASSWEEALREHAPSGGQELPAGPLIEDLAYELETNRNLLQALAGAGIELTLDTTGGRLPIAMSSEDLTRILVNLVRNAVEAMPNGGRLQLTLRELPVGPAADPLLLLSVEDNGPGIPAEMLERIFEPGYTTRSKPPAGGGWQGDHLGLGLSITRSIVEAAGGCIRAAGRDPSGVCFQIELPLRVA